jgi:DNA mismatch repair protein MLH1
MRKSLEVLYSPFLPKGTHPFVYVSLQIKPQNLDVNVHPTKQQVHFLREREIIENICEVFQKSLSGHNVSRTYSIQVCMYLWEEMYQHQQQPLCRRFCLELHPRLNV